MKKTKTITEQENFWLGKFGDEYINRNNHEEFLSSKINLFANYNQLEN